MMNIEAIIDNVNLSEEGRKIVQCLITYFDDVVNRKIAKITSWNLALKAWRAMLKDFKSWTVLLL